jgi:hypothetical protein
MTVTAALLAVLVGTPVVGGDVMSRVHLRTAALDSAAVSWFETRAKLDFEPELGDMVSAKLGLEFLLDAFPQLGSADQLGEAARFEPVTPLLGETYLRLHNPLPGLTLTAGRQLVHWGTADAINPTDNWNPPDYSDPLTWDARRPSWMVHADYSPATEFGMEFAAKPLFEPALSVPDRWLHVDYLPSESVLREGLVQQFIGYGLDSATARLVAGMYAINIAEEFQLPGNRLKEMTYGGRVRTHFSIFDVSASVVRGYDFLPTAVPEVVTDTATKTMSFTLHERYARRTIIGGDVATNLADIGLWAEAAWSTCDDSLPEDELSVIAGFDYNLAGFYLNCQYLHGPFPLALTQTSGEPAKDFLLAALERKLFAERLLVRAGGAVDVKQGSVAFLPLVRWAPVSSVELDLTGLVFAGKAESAFAPLDATDEVCFGVRYRF